MKRSTFITIISLLIPLLGMGQSKTTIVDDLYLKPSDVQSQQIQPTQKTKPTPNYKNGAREIVYIERENPNAKVIHDTVYVVGQAGDNLANKNTNGIHDTIYVAGPVNDSIENNQEQGHYLNGFNGTESDLEYAERIRRFHNPKYEIWIGDPRYNDINFLNNNDWNVYVDGSYAYVTPTWTNPYWWNYNYSPYSYGNWGYGFNNFYSPFSYYSGWCSPWGFDNFYGGYGYGGYGGYGYDGYGYGGYGGYGYGGYGGYGYGGYGNNWTNNQGRNPAHDEGTRRDASNAALTGRVGGTGNSAQSMSGGGGYVSSNPYTVVRNSTARTSPKNNVGSTPVTRSGNLSNTGNTRIISTNRNGIGLVRTGGLRNLNGINQFNGGNTGSRTSTTYTINTAPRTTINRNSSNSVSNQTSGNSRTSYSTNTNSGNYSTDSRRSSSPVNSNSGRSSSSYNSSNYNSSSNSSPRSSSSYSGGSSSSSSNSSSSSSSGSSSGGSRSSGGGGGRR